MGLTLHGGGQGFESPRLHFEKPQFCRQKRNYKERLGIYTRPFLHQSDNRGTYVGWRRAGARPGGWVGALRDGGFGTERVTGSLGARVTVAPWCATSSEAPWSKV